MESIETKILIYAAIALIIYFAIIYFAVANATSSLLKWTKAQTKLMELIARKQGATEEEVKKAYEINV